MSKQKVFNQIVKECVLGNKSVNQVLNEKYKGVCINSNDLLNYIKFNIYGERECSIRKSVERLRRQGFVA